MREKQRARRQEKEKNTDKNESKEKKKAKEQNAKLQATFAKTGKANLDPRWRPIRKKNRSPHSQRQGEQKPT